MNVLVLIISSLLGAEPADQPAVVIVLGAPGTPEYGKNFSAWADRWQRAADQGGAKCLRLGEAEADESPDRDRLEAIFQDQPNESAAPLWLVFIGHGTFDGRSAKFNLRGPDVTAADVARWLAPFKRPVAVINCASSSAPFINRLSGADRVVVTATKSGFELNYARFGDYLSDAIGDPAADLDKDEQTSLLEAFLSASRRASEFYQQEARLATETALLDDNGDGLGTPAAWFRGTRATRRARDGASTDGTRAHQLHLIRSENEERIPDRIRRRRDELEREIAALRDSRTEETDEDEYYRNLEPLLVELARLYAELDESADLEENANGVPQHSPG